MQKLVIEIVNSKNNQVLGKNEILLFDSDNNFNNKEELIEL